jgi:hypothetical protein
MTQEISILHIDLALALYRSALFSMCGGLWTLLICGNICDLEANTVFLNATADGGTYIYHCVFKH